MRLLVIGLGHCGSNIADGFALINRRAGARRGVEIVTGAFAVNTNLSALSGLSHIKSDYKHRILMGGRKAGGQGIGSDNELGAQIAREDADHVIDALRSAPRFHESDAFLLCAGAAGGTGSGAIPVMTQILKERYRDKPIYNLIVLPFEHEEHTDERAVYNSATCLKSAGSVADAIFLIDNQRYVRKDSPARMNLAGINNLIVAPFYDILCAGEAKKRRHIGVRLLDASDIIQSLSGWTAVGFGHAAPRRFRLPFWSSRASRQRDSQVHRGIEAMEQAISELSFNCDPADAARALYLISAPSREISVAVVKELGEHLRNLAPEAVIRTGDSPRGSGGLDISVVLSEFRSVEKVRRYYAQTALVVAKSRDLRRKLQSQDGETDEVDDAPDAEDQPAAGDGR